MVKTLRGWLAASVAVTALSGPVLAQGRDPLAPETEGPVAQNTLILPPIIAETPAGAPLPPLPRPGAEAQAAADAAKAKMQAAADAAKAKMQAEADAEDAAAEASERNGVGGPEIAEGDAEDIDPKATAQAAEPPATADKQTDPANPLRVNPQPVLAKAPVSTATHAEAKAAEAAPKPAPSPLEKFTIEHAAKPGTVHAASSSPVQHRTPVMAPPSSAAALSAPGMVAPQPKDWHFVIAGGAGFGTYDLGTPRYLGAARPAATINGIIPVLEANTPRQINTVAVEDSDDVVIPFVNLTLNTSRWLDPIRLGSGDTRPKTTWLQFKAGGFDADFSTRIDSFTPAPGDQLLIPGVAAVTPGGIDPVLGNYVFADARARNIAYNADDGVRFGHLYFGQTCDYGHWELSGFGGLGLTLRDHTQSFAFDVESQGGAGAPPAGTHLAAGLYTTDIDSETYSFTLGLKARTHLDHSRRLAVDAYAKASLDIIDSELNDAYELRRPLLPILRQTTNASVADTGFGYGAGLGLSYALTERLGVRVAVDVASQEQHLAVRNALNPTTLDLDRTTVVAGSVGLSVKF